MSAQGFQREVVGNPFLELAHAHVAQSMIEFGLAEEDDLQKLVSLGLKVGEQANFFERFRRHRVRFVNQDDHLATGGVNLQQAFLQAAQQQVRPAFGERRL